LESNKNLIEKIPELKKIKIEDKEEIKVYEFKIKLIDCNFKDGYIEFQKKIELIDFKLNFRIYNNNIILHFEFIKYFFVKALNLETKNINVKTKILMINNRFSKIISTFSEEIKNINEKIIDIAKWLYIKSNIQKISSDSKKIILDTEDIFKPEDLNSDFKPPTAEELINQIDRFEIRNKLQLKYLSGKLQNPNYQLKFTAKTKNENFGYLFFITLGEKMFHFVWELLDSNATYIWSFDKDENNKLYIKTLYQKIENTIAYIIQHGRTKYLGDYKLNLIDQDIVFDRIRHENINSQIEHFSEWKNNLNRRLL